METDYMNQITANNRVPQPKILIAVRLKGSTDGNMFPLCIKWQNGCIYEIERIIDIKPRGPYSVIYKVMINGKQRCLYYENKKWLVESKG